MVIALLAGSLLAGCSESAPPPTPAIVMNSNPHLTLDQLRSRPIASKVDGGHPCPVSPPIAIKPRGETFTANGKLPFYFGPWGGLSPGAGDFNKTPWFVDLAYKGSLLVRGRRLDGPGQVGFGFWPQGFGTPAAQTGVEVLFSRSDSEGRLVVYQPEMEIGVPAGGHSDGHYWSFPVAGCYGIQADGDRFSNLTIVLIR